MNSQDAWGRVTRLSGVLLTVVGVVLLFFVQNIVGALFKWSPAALSLLGLYYLFKVLFRHGRPSYVFYGMVLFLGGAFMVLLSNDLLGPLGIRELWPVFMGIVGLSLIPYGSRYRRTSIRVSLVIPGIFLILLMVVFLLFSLSVVKESLAEFIGHWWPLVVIFMGLTLMAATWLHQPEE